jgi:hypothetical protein
MMITCQRRSQGGRLPTLADDSFYRLMATSSSTATTAIMLSARLILVLSRNLTKQNSAAGHWDVSDFASRMRNLIRPTNRPTCLVAECCLHVFMNLNKTINQKAERMVMGMYACLCAILDVSDGQCAVKFEWPVTN